LPLLVLTATTPVPTLFWDDHNGHQSNISIAVFPTNSIVYLDDIALSFNGSNKIFAYVTCRALLSNYTTEIHLLSYQWNTTTFVFDLLPYPTLITTRPTGTDVLDGVRISIDKYQGTNHAMIVWQRNGNIYANYGTVNFVNGTINYTSGYQGFLLYQGNTVTYPGKFSCPDLSMEGSGAVSGHFAASAIHKTTTTENIVVATDAGGAFNQPAFYNLYTNSNISKRIRTARIDIPHKYSYLVSFNEVDLVNKKSSVYIKGGNENNFSNLFLLNSSLEQTCTNNANYHLTGLPAIKVAQALYNPSFYGCNMEIAWQQVFCSGTDYCTIQVVSKRLFFDMNNGISPQITALFNDQYFHINDDLSKNSFFPAIASDYANCKIYYSFGLMDKNTSANGKLAYKQTNCNGNAIRMGSNTIVVNENEKTRPFEILIFPNPANSEIFIESRYPVKKMELFNNNGLLVESKKFPLTRHFAFNGKTLPNGQYLIKLYSNGGNNKTGKTIIQQ
jgi:hypothetical protein